MKMMEPKPGAGPEGRRRFCGLAFAAAAMAVLPGAARQAPPDQEQDSKRVTAETRAALPPGTIKDYRKLGGFFLIADGKGIYAVSSTCTHRGCTVALEGNTGFGCPCHDSEYDLLGNVVQGPAQQPLKHFLVTESKPEGPLVVDIGQAVDAGVRL